MKVGCNYWASNAGTRMWKDWNEDVVRQDFIRMREAGLQVVRVFPMWSEFQPIEMVRSWQSKRGELLMHGKPLPDTPCGRAGVDEEQIRRFRWMADLAQEQGLQLIVAIVTGWMSGVMFMPPALQDLNFITDPLAVKWELRFVRCFVRELKDKPAIIMWELGNECNCLAHIDNPDQAWMWTNSITSAIRLEDSTRPVASGMHGIMPAVDEEFSSPVLWSIETQGELCDYLTSHPYPHTTTKSSARVDAHTSIRLLLQAAIENRLYGDISRRPSFVEELGTFSSSYCSEEMKADFVRGSLYQSWAHDSAYYLWWCGFEHSILDFPPYTWSTWERELGMYDENYRLRPVGRTLKEFRETLDSLPVQELPAFRRNAVCVLTRDQDFGSFMENGWAAFILAKQAGFDIEFQYIDEPLRDSRLYLVPGVRGTNWSRSFEYNALVEKARAGAVVYFSLEGGDVSNFHDVFGATVMTRETRTKPFSFAFNNQNFSLNAPYRMIIRPETAEVLGTEANGNPVFIRNRIGSGCVYLMTVPVERHVAGRPGAFTADDEPAWCDIYRTIGADAIASRIAVSNNPQVTLTEHYIDDSHAWLLAVNNQTVPASFDVVVAPEWKQVWAQSDGLIPPQTGRLFKYEK